MARSSDVLDLAVEGTQKKKSRKKLIVGIAMLGIIPLVGSTFAASITLNGGSNIEFGQGNQAVVSCDTDGITITPISSFDTSNFELSSIKVSNVSSNCSGKTFTVIARDSSGTEISGAKIVFTLAASGTAVSTSTGSSSTPSSEYGTTGMTFTLSNTSVSASSVSRITLETN